MCIAPVKIYNSEGEQLVSCRECWQCRQRKIDDYVGRNIAESKTAVQSHAFTLTYGTDKEGSADHIRARILTYSDVQKFFKRLRFDGFPCRYFVVGEYGETKGRAHWHGLVYWTGKVPDIQIRKEKCYSIAQWEHGYSFFDNPSTEAIRYACKYIQKDMHVGGRQGVCHYSRMPPLGTEYFKRLAKTYVAAGKAPNDLAYSFPGVERRVKGQRERKKIEFRMRGKSAEIFIDTFLDEWKRVYGTPWNPITKGSPPSEAVEERMDALAREEMDAARGPKIAPVDKNDPEVIRQGKALKARLLYQELKAEAAWADSEEPTQMDAIAEMNYVTHTLMKPAGEK